MESNQYATNAETSVWYEVRSTSAAGKITVSDHDTRDHAAQAAYLYECGHPGETVSIHRVRGYNPDA